jgi:hypothetical protein
MKTGSFTLNQPCTVYLLVNQLTWTDTDLFCDGLAATCAIAQSTTTPAIVVNAGSAAASNTKLTVATYGAVAAVFNGASSSIKVNNTAETTGNAGANNPGGFVLGGSRAGATFGNIQVKEVIVFADAHDATTRGRVISYLKTVGQLSF